MHNIGMERQCGKIAKAWCIACSEQIHHSAEMSATEGWPQSFLRGYRAAALAKREVELLWSKQTKDFARGSTEKQELGPSLQRGPLRSRRWSDLCKGVH